MYIFDKTAVNLTILSFQKYSSGDTSVTITGLSTPDNFGGKSYYFSGVTTKYDNYIKFDISTSGLTSKDIDYLSSGECEITITTDLSSIKDKIKLI